MRLFLLSILFFSSIHVNSSFTNETLINSFEEDITGNYFREYIRLEGKLFNKNSLYFHDVWLSAESVFDRRWKIPLHNGYDPQIELIDLNGDDILDIFYQAATGSDKQTFKHQFYTLKKGEITEFPSPEFFTISASLGEPYKVIFSFPSPGDTMTFDIRKPSPFFHRNGTIKGKRTLIVVPKNKLDLKWIDQQHGYGLVGTQIVKDELSDEILGGLNIVYILRENKWLVFNYHWVEQNFYSQKNLSNHIS